MKLFHLLADVSGFAVVRLAFDEYEIRRLTRGNSLSMESDTMSDNEGKVNLATPSPESVEKSDNSVELVTVLGSAAEV